MKSLITVSISLVLCACSFAQSQSKTTDQNKGLDSIIQAESKELLLKDGYGAISADKIFVVFTPSVAYVFYQEEINGKPLEGHWDPIPLEKYGAPIIGFISSGRNIVIYTKTHAIGFYYTLTNGSLSKVSNTAIRLNSQIIGAVSSNSQIVIFTKKTAHAFYQRESPDGNLNDGQWKSN